MNSLMVPALLKIPSLGDETSLLYAAKVLLTVAGIETDIQVSRGFGEECGLELPGAFIPVGDLREIFSWLTLQYEKDCGLRNGQDRWERPWISELARDIASRIGVTSGIKKKAFQVIITHDVDRTLLCEPFSLCKTILNGLGLMKRECYPVSAVLDTKAVLRSVDRLLQFEVDHGIRSIFFVMSGPFSFARYGTRYDVRWKISREIIKLVQDTGMLIGLHGSYYATQKDSYGDEKKRLEDVLGQEVVLHRNHYLHFDPRKTWTQLEKAGFKWDFSVGFNDRMGFRSGVAYTYEAFDLETQEELKLRLVPLAFMDGVFAGWPQGETVRKLRDILEGTKTVGGIVSILFHPDRFSMRSEAWELFVRAVEGCEDLGAEMGNFKVLRDPGCL